MKLNDIGLIASAGGLILGLLVSVIEFQYYFYHSIRPGASLHIALLAVGVSLVSIAQILNRPK